MTKCLIWIHMGCLQVALDTCNLECLLPAIARSSTFRPLVDWLTSKRTVRPRDGKNYSQQRSSFQCKWYEVHNGLLTEEARSSWFSILANPKSPAIQKDSLSLRKSFDDKNITFTIIEGISGPTSATKNDMYNIDLPSRISWSLVKNILEHYKTNDPLRIC